MNPRTLRAFREEFQKIASEEKIGGLMDYLSSPQGEHHGDLAGLGLMAASSMDRLKSQLQHKDDEKGSLVGGDTGRTGMDLAGLGLMTAPTLASIYRGTGSKFTNAANLAGLAALIAPTADKLQANIRAKRQRVDPDKKMLMGHKAHAISELAGLGLLSAPVVRNLAKGHIPLRSGAMTLGGYGTLAAPVVEDLVQHDEKKKIFQGPTRTVSELGGLGLLAGGAISGH